jgi:hypothetical protein
MKYIGIEFWCNEEETVEIYKNIVKTYYCKGITCKIRFMILGIYKEYGRVAHDRTIFLDLFKMYEEYDFNTSYCFCDPDSPCKFGDLCKFDDLVMSYKYKMKYERGRKWKGTELYKNKRNLIRSMITLGEVLHTGYLLYVKKFLE